jgi:hypothetical protein
MHRSDMNQLISRFTKFGGAVLIGSAFLILPKVSIANPAFDGQTVKLQPGDSVRVDCISEEASSTGATAALNQVGNTRYYAVGCEGSVTQTSSTMGHSSAMGQTATTSQAAQAAYEDHPEGGILHVSSGQVKVDCASGTANIAQYGNTRYYKLECSQ